MRENNGLTHKQKYYVQLKLKLKCTVLMGRDHGHPYTLSTTVLSDNSLGKIKLSWLLVYLHLYNGSRVSSGK